MLLQQKFPLFSSSEDHSGSVNRFPYVRFNWNTVQSEETLLKNVVGKGCSYLSHRRHEEKKFDEGMRGSIGHLPPLYFQKYSTN